MGTSLRKRLAIIFLLMLCALAGVYLALPLWLPSLVRAQLTPGWQLESLAFDYPVSFVLHVNTVVLSGDLDGIGVRLAARDLDIDIHRLSLDAASVDVDIVLNNRPGETASFGLDDLAVPVIFQPGKLPRVSIDSLRLNLHSDGMLDRSLLFTELRLARNENAESRLKTSLPLLGVSGLSGQIEIRMRRDSLEAKLQLDLPDHNKVAQFDFRQSQDGGEISSVVLGQGRLQELHALLLATFPAMESLDQLKSMQGQVTFEGHFSGNDKQTLDHATLSAQNVIIDLGSANLGLDVKLEVQREAGSVLINFPGPGTFRFSDSNNRISGLLETRLPLTQNNARAAQSVNDSLLLAIEPGSKIRLQTGARPAGEFSGAVAAEFSSAGLDLSLELAPDANFRITELFNPQSLTGAGTIDIKLESRQALTFETTASPSLPLGASLQGSGWLELDGRAVRFTESTGLRVFIPRLIAHFDSESVEFHDLELSGITEFSLPVTGDETAAEFRYSGSVSSESARLSQSQAGQAPQALIAAESISLQLDFSQSGEQLHTSGAGTAHKLQMDSSGISASQVDFEWRKVDPLALTGEFRTHTQGLVFSHEEGTYQGVDLDVTYALLSAARVEGQGDLLLARDIRTPVRFSGWLDSGDWVIDILPSHLSLLQAVTALEAIIGPVPDQLELGGGTIDIDGSFSMGIAVQGNINISGTALGFSLAESTVEGVDFNITGKLQETLAGTGWLSIDRIRLAAGLNLLQTRVSIGLMTPDTFELDDLQAEFFGGQLSVDQLRFSPEGLSDTQIKMTDIDLEQVLEYIDVGGLTGTGRLAISLPTGSQGSSFYVRNGVFRANGPGILSYAGAISAAPVENIGLFALENFHYSELDGTIDYHPDGSYRLMIHLAGSNPDLYDGYPIALTLNIGGMLPEAFEVLFLTGDFDKAILNRIRQENVN
ncbi:MAG: YdbH domain-containing protein [Xanthomonadales bacterium]